MPKEWAEHVPELRLTPSEDMNRNLMEKTREVFLMHGILEKRVAILAPLCRNGTVNQIERAMLLADLMGLAANFASKAGKTEYWSSDVEVDTIKKMCNCMRSSPNECFPKKFFINRVRELNDLGNLLWGKRSQVCHADVNVSMSDNSKDSLLRVIENVTQMLDEWV